MSEGPIPLSELRRALVIKLRHHGDVLLTSPVFSCLKAAAPDCEIDGLVYRDTVPLLEEHPAITRLHTIDRGWKALGPLAQLQAEGRLLRDLRQRQYDLIIHLTEHRRGAWLSRYLAPRWSVAPARRQAGRFWRRSFTHLIAAPSNALRHTVERNLDGLRVLGIHPPPAARGLVLVPGAAAEARVAGLLASAGLAGGDFIHIHPGSRWLFKCWPGEHMAALLALLHQAGQRLVLTAAPDPRERAMIEALRAAGTPFTDLSGQLSLRELAALTARARLFVGVDSAPMHIAAAMGTPTVALFGPSGDKEWGPWQVAQRVLTSDHSCRPCGRDGCGGSKVSDCLVQLPVARVHQACHELLAR